MKYFVLPLSWATIIAILSLTSGSQLPEVNISYIDKIAHVFIYFVLVIASIWAILKKNQGISIPFTTLFIIFTSSCIYGILIEVLQITITTGRNFEIPDIIANIIGCLFGVFLYKPIQNLSS